MDMHESYNKLVIARAILVLHIGYWHGSDVEPEGRKLILAKVDFTWLHTITSAAITTKYFQYQAMSFKL